MEVIEYSPAQHKQIVAACVAALEAGQTVVYPTDTSYGICCDLTNSKGRRKFYQIKEREISKPVHVIAPSLAWGKQVAKWNRTAAKLVKKFWPGPLSLALPLKGSASRVPEYLKIISGGTGTVGLRLPDNNIARDLARGLGKPIPATSANPSGKLSRGYDSYSARDVIAQFRRRKHKPDIIINAGQLPKRAPSTFVKITGSQWEILRPGPITETQIKTALRH